MKKLMVSIIVLVLAICAGNAAYASSASDATGVLLTVGPQFTFAIGESVVDMGTVTEGNAGVGGITMYCSTNQGNAWQILVGATPVVGGSTGATFPIVYAPSFQTYALPDGAGVNSAGTFITNNTRIAPANTTAYRCALSEKSDTDVRVGMVLLLHVPSGTRADTYATTITATMTE